MKRLILLLMLLIMAWSGQCLAEAPTNGLVAYYSLDGNANDESGNSLNGDETNINYSEGIKDLSAIFDGTSYIAIDNPGAVLQNLSSVTISAWVKPNDLSRPQRVVAHWTSGDSNGQSFVLSFSNPDNNFQFDVKTEDSGLVRIDSSVHISTEEWYHVVGIYNGSNIFLYVDGVKETGDSVSGQIENRTDKLYIGQGASSRFPNYLLDGMVDEIRIYNRALSESEIQELYHEGEICEDRYDEGYQAGRQACIDDPASCGIEINGSYRPPFTGVLAENIQSYLVLTENSVPFYMSPGSYVQAFGSEGINTVNVEKYARVQFRNFVDENEVNIEEASSEFTVYRSGATVYLNSTSGTRVEIAATETPQILRFADGSLELAIITGNVMLGGQLVDEAESLVDSPADQSDTSESIF